MLLLCRSLVRVEMAGSRSRPLFLSSPLILRVLEALIIPIRTVTSIDFYRESKQVSLTRALKSLDSNIASLLECEIQTTGPVCAQSRIGESISLLRLLEARSSSSQILPLQALSMSVLHWQLNLGGTSLAPLRR